MIVCVMGVSGCGKSTVGRLLAERLRWEFIEGDDFHSPENVARMRAGFALTDTDRQGWLDRLRDSIAARAAARRSAVLACSALRQKYRDHLQASGETIRWVYMKGEYEAIRRRIEGRHGHYMPATLLQSQFATLEEPADALTLSIALTPDEAVRRALEALGLPLPDGMRKPR